MGVLSRLTSAVRGYLPGGSANWTPDWIAAAGGTPAAPFTPSPAESLGVSAVYSAVALLAGSLAGANLSIVRKGSSGGQEAVTGTAVAGVLADLQFEVLESWLFDALVSGNGYLVKRYDGRGALAQLQWMPSHRVAVAVADEGEVWYEVMEDGSVDEDAEVIPAKDMVHLRFRAVGRHRWLGVSPLVTCAPSMGLVVFTRRAGVAIYRNASLPSILVKHPARMDAEAILRIKSRFIEATSSENVGKPVVLTEGMDATVLDVSKAVQLQLVEMSALGVKEVSRVYGVPPHLLGEPGSTNYSTAAESSRSFVNITLQPWAIRVGDCLSHALLDKSDRAAGVKIAFDLSSLTRGSGTELADTTSKLVNGGIVSANEARQWLGLGDIPGGETLRLPVNTMSPTAWLEQGQALTPPPPGAGAVPLG